MKPFESKKNHGNFYKLFFFFQKIVKKIPDDIMRAIKNVLENLGG